MRAVILTAALSLAACGASAGPIERACLQSGRQAATPALCGCIQRAADQTLSRADQSRAATFFRDPHRAQEVRQSKRAADEEFWRRYRAFGAAAESACS
jgi:hypothetical protein